MTTHTWQAIAKGANMGAMVGGVIFLCAGGTVFLLAGLRWLARFLWTCPLDVAGYFVLAGVVLVVMVTALEQ